MAESKGWVLEVGQAIFSVTTESGEERCMIIPLGSGHSCLLALKPAANDFSYRTCSMLRFHTKCVVNVLPYIVQYLF